MPPLGRLLPDAMQQGERLLPWEKQTLIRLEYGADFRQKTANTGHSIESLTLKLTGTACQRPMQRLVSSILTIALGRIKK